MRFSMPRPSLPFVLPPSARQSGLSPLRAFPEWLEPLRSLPGPVLVRSLAIGLLWTVAAIYSYDTWICGFLGSQALGADLGTLFFLAFVFVAGRFYAYALGVVLVLVILEHQPIFGLLDMNLAPIQLFVFILWLAFFAGRPQATPNTHVYETGAII